MLGKQKKQAVPIAEEKKAKPTPAFLCDDYPYKAVGEPIADLDALNKTGVLYEIKCNKCGMSIRTQGCNIKATYDRMVNGVVSKNEDGATKIEGGKGCLVCGNKEFVIREVDTSKIKK